MLANICIRLDLVPFELKWPRLQEITLSYPCYRKLGRFALHLRDDASAFSGGFCEYRFTTATPAKMTSIESVSRMPKGSR